MNDFKFSIIIPTYNSELGLKETINSIIGQTLNFKDNIEIVIVDRDSEDRTEEICRQYQQDYPDNVKFIQLNVKNLEKSKNEGIKHSSGKFISFLEPHDHYSKNTLLDISSFINKNDDVNLIIIPIIYFKNGRKVHYLNKKLKKTIPIDLLKQPEYCQFIGLSTFFKNDSNKQINDIPHADITFFSEKLIDNPNLGVCSTGTYYSNNIDEKIYPKSNLKIDAEYYEKFIAQNLSYLIEKSLDKFNNVPEFIQLSLINHLRWLLSIRETSENIDLTKLHEIIKNINEKLLLTNNLLVHEHKIFSCLLKYNELSEKLKEKLNLNTIFIDTYDIINDELHILASKLTTSEIDVNMYVNEAEVNKKEIRFPQKDEYSLGCNFAKDYSFEVQIPITTQKEFKLEFKQERKVLHIDFSRPCNFSRNVGYAKTRHYLSVLNEDSIIIKKKTTANWIKQELKSLVHMTKQHEPGFYKAIPFRILYMIGYPFLRNKKIWFYMDRPDESDDNGLALFRYVVEKDEDIDKYFILDSNNKDFEKIKEIGKVIPYKSLKHRYLGMFAENIITSHPDNEIIYPFWGSYPFFAGLLKSNNVFLQHGILKDDISSWLNKSNMNLSLFVVSSPKEYESVFEYPYNYDRNVVKLLGLPRYDTLENQKDKKQIIIMPSWRRDLDHKSKEYVKENEFFKRFNSLINNKRLISKAKEHNYEIIFRPHPKVYAYIDLFTQNNYVKIDYDKTKYQTLFNNGSIMITDYSSVSFDFAYLYKPVLYYQYASDYHFDLEDSYYDYETMGFGEVVRTEDELVDLIIEYMENNCRLKDKYNERVKEFFLFTDKNNRERVYNEIKNIPLKD